MARNRNRNGGAKNQIVLPNNSSILPSLTLYPEKYQLEEWPQLGQTPKPKSEDHTFWKIEDYEIFLRHSRDSDAKKRAKTALLSFYNSKTAGDGPPLTALEECQILTIFCEDHSGVIDNNLKKEFLKKCAATAQLAEVNIFEETSAPYPDGTLLARMKLRGFFAKAHRCLWQSNINYHDGDSSCGTFNTWDTDLPEKSDRPDGVVPGIKIQKEKDVLATRRLWNPFLKVDVARNLPL